MKLDSATVILAVGIATLVWWQRRQPPPSVVPTTVLPPPAPASDVGVAIGRAERLFDARTLAIADLHTRFGTLAGWTESKESDIRVTRILFRNVQGGTADSSATYRYAWQPADGAVKRL